MTFKKSLLVLISIFWLADASANALPEREFVRKNFPSFETVFSKVMQQLDSYCEECYYGIAKKPSGYFLTITPFSESEPSQFFMVWDRNNSSFVTFDVSEFKSEQRLGPEPPEEFKTNYQQADFYDFYLYYGYNGWIEDTRALLEKYPIKTDQDLEILARTFSNEATEAAHPGVTQNFVDYGGLFEDNGFAKATNTQTAFFEEAANNSIELWKQLKRDYPEYVSFNGDPIALKLSSEYMHFYELASSIKANSIAATYFKNTYYSEAWIQFARNVLNACDENGILFTSNSKDTYPVLYAQEKLGIREDVVVVNASLLNAKWYWEMQLQSSKLNSSIDAKMHNKLSEKPIYMDYSAEAAPFKQWLENELKSDEESSYRLVPRELFLNYQGTNLDIELKTQGLMTSDVIILDLLSNNPDKTAFTSAPYGLVAIGLYYYLAPTGRAFALVPDRIAAMEKIKTVEKIEDFAFYTTTDYLKALGPFGETELSMLSYLIINVSPVFQNRKEKLVDKVNYNIPVNDAVATEDFALLDALNAFYEVMHPNYCEDIRTELQPVAQDYILNTSALSLNLETRITNLERIFSIYAHFRVHETPEWSINQQEAPELSGIEKSILKELQEKANSLFENPVVRQREVTMRKVYRLLRSLELLSLE